MKILDGKKNLGKFYESNLILDLDSLLRYRGEHGKVIAQDKTFSRVMILLGVLSLIVWGSVVFLSATFKLQDIFLPKAPGLLFLPLGLAFLMYGAFLGRDREEFDFSLERDDFLKVVRESIDGRAQDIFIDRFISANLFSVIDQSYFPLPQKFIQHLFLKIIWQPDIARLIEKRLGVKITAFSEKAIWHLNSIDTSFENNYRDFFLRVFDTTMKCERAEISSEVIFFVVCKFYLQRALFELGLTDADVEALRMWFVNNSKSIDYYKKWKKLSKLKPQGAINRSYTSRGTPVLDSMGTDFTIQASQGNFMLSLGKEEQMSRLLNSLQKQSGAAIMILGEPGVGKTRFLRHLATRMAVEDLPRALQDWRLVVLDLNKIFTETSTIESFKQNLQRIFDEIKSSGNIILVLEELSQIMNIREDGRMEVVNLLINTVSSSKLKIIATSNNSNYTKYIKPNRAFASLFETIELKLPDDNVSTQILLDEVTRIERKFGVTIAVNGVKRIVQFANKFDNDRVMPDKGIDLLEEAAVMVKSRGKNTVDAAIVDNLLSEKIGVNVGYISEGEAERLKNLESRMHSRVVGQDEAIRYVCAAIKRSRSGLGSQKRPLASFLFYGPTGVGKTEVAKTLAELYYGGEQNMIRLDMSEYQEQENLNRLLGFMDKDGNFVGGYLTEAVRNKPFSLVLLDEIEKANKKVLDLFLQVLDDGFMTDGLGRKIDFTNTIVVATSNAASDEIATLIKSGDIYTEIEIKTKKTLQQVFRVEFLNRFDKVIMFRPLTKDEVGVIIKIMLSKLAQELVLKGITFRWKDSTIDRLVEKGYNQVFGARELRRVVQDSIQDEIANLIIDGKIRSGSIVEFDGLVANIYQ